MANYIYDGSFEGLLTAIFVSYEDKDIPANITDNSKVQMDLINENKYINTDVNKSNRVYNALREKISSRALRNVYYCYLSELDGIEIIIYRYIKFGLKVGAKVDRYEFDDTVKDIHEISRKVSGEAHRMLGLLRFSNVYKDIYCSKIEPDHNIIGLMSPHFAERMKDQRWIIHDIKRSIASIYDKRQWIISDFNEEMDYVSNTEKEFQNMWEQYYNSIGIKERRNDKVKKQYMPVRYWKHLTELNYDNI